jgi:hypothetical protein
MKLAINKENYTFDYSSFYGILVHGNNNTSIPNLLKNRIHIFKK